jgi:hypothetical protein
MVGGYIKNAVEKAMRKLFYLRQKNPGQKLDQELLKSCGQAELGSKSASIGHTGVAGFVPNPFRAKHPAIP